MGHHRDLATLPEHVTVHVLPTGGNPNERANDLNKLRYNRRDTIADSVARGHRAAAAYVAERVT